MELLPKLDLESLKAIRALNWKYNYYGTLDCIWKPHYAIIYAKHNYNLKTYLHTKHDNPFELTWKEEPTIIPVTNDYFKAVKRIEIAWLIQRKHCQHLYEQILQNPSEVPEELLPNVNTVTITSPYARAYANDFL